MSPRADLKRRLQVPPSNRLRRRGFSTLNWHYDFEVVTLNGSSLSKTFGQILASYLKTRRNKRYSKTDEEGNKRAIWALFERAERLLEESSVLSQRPHVQVSWSIGVGNWAHVPQIALLDERVTSTMLEGFYPVYLFRADMSGIYLKYGCGIQRPVQNYGTDVGHAIIENRAEWLRRRSTGLKDRGFVSDKAIDLRREGGGNRGSKVSKIIHQFYDADSLPNDEALLSDLDALLQVYDQHVSERKPRTIVHVDQARLATAADSIIRPAIIRRGDLGDGGQEGYHHRKILPKSTPHLTPSALASRPIEAVEEALKADVNLLSQYDKMFARTFLGMLPSDEVAEHVSNLLYGPEPLNERTRTFLEWGQRRERDDGAQAQFNGTVASYLLACSDPQEFAFCKTRRAYKPAVRALLGEEEVRSDWPDRIAHAQSFYREVLHLFQDEYDLPFFDLLHVHIAFFLAENEDKDAPWGEGVLNLGEGADEAEPSEDRTVVKIAPGHRAEYWDDCRDEGYISVGWGAVGNLRSYDSLEALREAFREAFYPEKHGTEQKITEKSAEIWTLRQLEPGDLVVANRGINEVLAVGTVVEPGYEWRPERDEYPHTVRVEWDESYAQEIPPQKYWQFVTVKELSDEMAEHILERRGVSAGAEDGRQSYQPPSLERIYEAVQASDMVISRRTLRRYHVSLRTRGFVILSGVSGTGKTWLTELYADAVKARRLLQPVAPNWTTNEDLLGYYNPVDESYHHSEVSRFLQEAEAAYDEAQERGGGGRCLTIWCWMR